MPWFVLIGHDGPRGAELRKLHRPAHLAGLEPLAQAGRIRHAGPMLGDDGAPVGSVVVFEAASLAEAHSIAARERARARTTASAPARCGRRRSSRGPR